MKKRYAVLGIGRFGSKVARELFYKKQEVLAIDKDKAVIEGIKDQVSHAIVGDIADETTLKEAGVGDCDVAIISESTNMESNIIAAQICKGLGVPLVICKAHNTIHGKVLAKLGVDQITFPEQDTAIKLVNRLTSQGVLDYFDLGENLTIVGTKTLPRWVGQKLSDLDLRNKFNVTVLALRREGENMVIPAWSTVVEKDDILVLFGREDSLKKLDLDITHKT
ncbi:TrkA family potassium uptake protein [Candidatus Saganbacteria bacterium]|uniref:TrkA family potassium uptake protein n=1 Tax=Candidatus Saganbacteria bacterium TaxID=2575572 RepID=A0A9D6UM94_UNCSA|nr:TrkA family potassium uptake protein [Candidatus Saganbacteria bacterium]